MKIRQLSIFLENKRGTLLQVLDVMKKAQVQLIASAIADTVEYGILRIICDNPQKAYDALKDAGIAVAMTEVFAIALDNDVGKGADVVADFAEAGISITYLYSFLLGGKGILIFRTNDKEAAEQVIERKKLNVVNETDLKKL